MAEERPPGATGYRPALEVTFRQAQRYQRYQRYYANVKIYSNPRGLAAAMVASSVATTALTLGACYRANPEATGAAVRSVFTQFAEVLGMRPSSILVELCFHTEERFLAFMDAFEKKIIKQRLQEELSKIGFKDELEVTIENDKEVYDTLNMIR